LPSILSHFVRHLSHQMESAVAVQAIALGVACGSISLIACCVFRLRKSKPPVPLALPKDQPKSEPAQRPPDCARTPYNRFEEEDDTYPDFLGLWSVFQALFVNISDQLCCDPQFTASSNLAHAFVSLFRLP
jgi:hypothetical protein